MLRIYWSIFVSNLIILIMNKFTRKMMLAIACIIAGCINVQAQYQLPNPGFEGTWKETTWGGFLGKSTENVPQYWHSFGTAAGNYQSMTKASVSQSTDTRTGSGSCAKISATNPIGSIVGNGTLTTGRMNAGSYTPDDETGNYNFTDPNDEEYQQKFTGRPDAISFWVKSKMASSTEEARMAAILHDNFRYQDPTKDETILSHKIGSAELNYTTTNEQWVQKTVNFEYTQDATPSFLLLTFTTNKTPGGGNKNDVVYIDDIEFIYNSKLESLKIGGIAVDGFDKDTYNYTITGDGVVPTEDQIEAVSDGKGASIETTINENVVTIVVNGNDYSENNDNTHTYTLTYQDTRSQLSSLSINGIALEGFSKDKYDYTVSGEVPAKDQIIAEADGKGATVDIEINKKVVTITVSGSNIATDPENKHVYTLTFDYEQGIENNGTTENMKVYSTNGNVFVQGYTGIVEIYLLNGGKVAQKEVSGNSMFRLEPNTYIIRTGTKATMVIVK